MLSYRTFTCRYDFLGKDSDKPEHANGSVAPGKSSDERRHREHRSSRDRDSTKDRHRDKERDRGEDRDRGDGHRSSSRDHRSHKSSRHRDERDHRSSRDRERPREEPRDRYREDFRGQEAFKRPRTQEVLPRPPPPRLVKHCSKHGTLCLSLEPARYYIWQGLMQLLACCGFSLAWLGRRAASIFH